MTQIYSKLLLARKELVGAAGASPPVGTIWVVRDIWCVWQGTTDLSTLINVYGDLGQAFFQSLITQLDANNLTFWQGRMVCNEALAVTTTSSTDVSISGYELTLP